MAYPSEKNSPSLESQIKPPKPARSESCPSQQIDVHGESAPAEVEHGCVFVFLPVWLGAFGDAIGIPRRSGRGSAAEGVGNVVILYKCWDLCSL